MILIFYADDLSLLGVKQSDFSCITPERHNRIKRKRVACYDSRYGYIVTILVAKLHNLLLDGLKISHKDVPQAKTKTDLFALKLTCVLLNLLF